MFQVKTRSFSISIDKEERQRAVDLARTYVGVPWRHQGRTPTGVDCVGLLFLVTKKLFEDLDIEFLNYGRWPRPQLLRENLKKFLLTIQKHELEPGDVVLMKAGWAVCHVGFYTGDTLIHANLVEGKVVEHRLDSEWNRAIVGCYRVPRYDGY